MASSSSYVQQKYQVFLSFRGEDTRNNFTSHLHAALKRKGIDTFVDYRLERGQEISGALLTAIEESKISIIILSKNYASSSWCLDELSKILECKKRNGQKVVPIFYHVEPSDVRKQTGTFAEAFAKHVKNRTDKVERWSAALKEVADLSGWSLQGQLNDRPESTLIVEIVKDISKKLMYKSLYDTKRLVGIDSRIERIESLLCIDSAYVRIIGIAGMGGIGKTTIAEAVYNLFFAEFDGFCFVNVKEELNRGRVHLREKLFSEILEDKNLNLGTSLLPASIIDRLHYKKIFIVLDDVNDSMQLLDLLPEKYYFGPGSRIIVISRDKQVLRQVVDEIYEVEGMVDDEALQLFSMYAFKQSHPKEDFMELSENVIHYAKGVPLALRVVGSALYGKSKCDWEGHLNKLENISDPKIDNMLRISYNGLDDEVKDIFLDIACFFRGNHKDYVENILDGCYISVSSGINVLVDKSLITISYNKLEMHDLLQLMAWNIIRQASKEPGKRSRLWTSKDICHVLKNNTVRVKWNVRSVENVPMGTESVEAMFLNMSKIGKICLNPTAFEKMCNLKLLKFYYTDFERDRKVYISQQGLEYLPDNLRYLHWDDYPSKSLPSNFCPENLVKLIMRNSHVEQLWNGVQDLVNLKWLDLIDSQHLLKIPDLSQATNLEIMKLDGCISLVEVPSSIDCLSRLESLDLGNCTRLERLPSNICKLKFLENLNLTGCLKLESFPEILETMECLRWISLSHTSIEELPSSIEHLVGLEVLNLDYCEKLKNLPGSIRKLKCLSRLSVRDCSYITMFPEIPGNLKDLNLSGTAIEQVPSSTLSGLRYLDLETCTKLRSLPRNIFKLENLHSFTVSGFSKLEVIQDLLGTVQVLYIYPSSGTAKIDWSKHHQGQLVLDELPDNLENLKSLKSVHLGECNLSAFPSRLTCISSLLELHLSRNNFETIPASIKELLNLKRLDLSYCKRLQSLPELPPNLKYLNADSCVSLEAVSSLFTIGCSTQIIYFFTNCLKLDQNAINHILAETHLWIQHRATKALKLYHEGSDDESSLTICLPGSEIPEWFSFQNTGSSVTTQLLLNGDDSKFVAFALCVVVAFEDYGEMVSLRCKYNFRTNNGGHHSGFCYFYRSKISVGSDNMFLGSIRCGWYSEVSFEFFVPGNGWRVKKCGVHPVYPQNDPVYNARVIQPSSNENLAAIHQLVQCQPSKSGSGSDCSDGVHPIIDYCYDEAEPSGSFDPGRDTIMIQPSSPYDSMCLSLNSGVIDQGFAEPVQEDGTIIKRHRDGHHNNEAEPSGDFSSEPVEEEARCHCWTCFICFWGITTLFSHQ